MNLKESFRYQSYLERLMREASESIQKRDHCLTVERYHKRHKADPDAEDMTETVEVDKFFSNNDVMRFMLTLIEEREKLTRAISRAKENLDIDIDAAIEANKFRQIFAHSTKLMLRCTESTKTVQGIGYKFNVAGDQTQYYYDIDVISKEAFDRNFAKESSKKAIMEADKTSADIDAAMINAVVDYQPMFDVNDSFEDVMSEFTAQ